jgi:hypothetical protein
VTWRTGRHVRRTVYIQAGDEASRTDKLVGLMDTPGLAALVVNAVNAWTGADLGQQEPQRRQALWNPNRYRATRNLQRRWDNWRHHR